MTAGPALALAGASMLALLGVLLLVAPRREGSWATRLRLAGVGEVSTVTVLVSGLVCLVIAYQIGARALGVHPFRVPVWLAVGGGAMAVALSLVTDAIQNAGDRSDDR